MAGNLVLINYRLVLSCLQVDRDGVCNLGAIGAPELAYNNDHRFIQHRPLSFRQSVSYIFVQVTCNS